MGKYRTLWQIEHMFLSDEFQIYSWPCFTQILSSINILFMDVCLRLLNKVWNAVTMPLGKKPRMAYKSKSINMFSGKYILSLEINFKKWKFSELRGLFRVFCALSLAFPQEKTKLGETQVLYAWKSIWKITMSILYLFLHPVHLTEHTNANISFQMHIQCLILERLRKKYRQMPGQEIR